MSRPAPAGWLTGPQAHPLTTIDRILDRADRGKHLTHTEVNTLRECITAVQTTTPRFGGAPQPEGHITRAQARVLAETARGGSSAQVAARLFLTQATVLNTLKDARRRVGATNTVQLLLLAIAAGDITVTPAKTPTPHPTRHSA